MVSRFDSSFSLSLSTAATITATRHDGKCLLNPETEINERVLGSEVISHQFWAEVASEQQAKKKNVPVDSPYAQKAALTVCVLEAKYSRNATP